VSHTASASTEVAEFWDRHLVEGTELNPYYRKFVDFAIARNRPAKPLRVLEVGCGNGLLSIYIARRYRCSVTGVDFSPKSIGWARRQAAEDDCASVTFLCGDIRDPRLPLDGPFDIIIGAAVLHEVIGPEFALLAERLKQLLSVDGYGVFLENSYFNPIFRLVRSSLPRRARLGHPYEYPFDKLRYRQLGHVFPVTRRDCIGVMLFHRFHAQLFSRLIDHVVISRTCDALDYWATRSLPGAWSLWLSYLKVVSFFRSPDQQQKLDFSVIPRRWMPNYKPTECL
jgi:SAM-dependent methyltransferase